MSDLDDPRDEQLRLGGMALENGLLVFGPTHWAAAIRDRDGGISVRSGKAPRFNNAFGNLPGVRGVMRLAESMAVLPAVRAGLPQSRMAFERPSVLAVGAATSAVSLFLRRRTKRGVGADLAISLLGLAPALVSLRGGNVAAYHGVEHKTIAAYEHGGDFSSAAAVAAAAKEHERCGSHLVAPMMLASVAGEAIMRRALKNPGTLAQTSVALAGAAVSVELFAFAERHPDSGFTKLFRLPGFEIQRAVGTREPTTEQIDVGRAAIGRLLAVEGAVARGTEPVGA